ncbi:PREDICTED: protein FAF-like, chloroplastic [Tarenaya hassleriana]|uniref:protein FAF-like, chloroplastic n=1 Tax=Tarenaya hassleriana TaxID=28532 RepID=UPI00053CA187|nr:PREDICTED: protein FAF-like, chloroplastic [Tarenaya hassleriana]
MAAFGSLRHIFENPKPEKPPKTLLESLSSQPTWSHKPTSEDETPSFTEIFGELHFTDKSHHVNFLDNHDNVAPPYASSSSSSSSALQLCTEGLGSESSYDVEDDTVKVNEEVNAGEVEERGIERERGRKKKKREYPPAMKRLSLKGHREEGRFVLEEVRIPRREILRASREDGRLTMKLVQTEDEIHD